ncbi:glutathione S-transferase U17-like [Apium graveolens]|uniref:glutathione S-transferase U17-like n=1 Tax=Apium graveolens TaxID=4045 RepID=UPI003D7A2C09
MSCKEVKVLGAWPSPYVMRPRISLNIKSVDYEFLQEKLGTKTELLLKSNPVHKKIPVLIHGDKSICESLIIVEYIDEVWSSNHSIMPSDPYDRAIARFWAAYLDEKWFPSLRSIATSNGEEEKNAAIKLVQEGLVLLEDAYTKCSRGKMFFGGEKIGYLDIALGSFLGWMRVTEKVNNVKLIDEANTPGLVNWAHNFCSDAAVKDVMPQTDKLYDFSKVLMAQMKAPPKCA